VDIELGTQCNARGCDLPALLRQLGRGRGSMARPDSINE
jgi:hypothetical protein